MVIASSELGRYVDTSAIAGELVSIRPDETQSGINYSLHWKTSDDRHTFLTIVITKNANGSYITARESIDSEEIRGQGDTLWNILTQSLQLLASRGFKPGEPPTRILHEVHTNDYSRRLPMQDPRYTQSPTDPTVFYGAYLPQPNLRVRVSPTSK